MRGIDAPRTKLGVEFGHCHQGVADHGERAMFHRVEPGGVDRDELRFWAERCPRARGEVHQPRAHGEDHIGLGRKRICRGGADDANWARMSRVVVREAALAGDGLQDRNTAFHREVRYYLFASE